MSIVHTTPIWWHLNAVPNVANWRRNRMNELEGFESELRELFDELLRDPSFLLWIKACERTRFYWSRFHAVAVTGYLPPKLQRSGYEFLEIMKDIFAIRNKIALRSSLEKELCDSYAHSMEIRCMLVRTSLESSMLVVRKALREELQDAYQFTDNWGEGPPSGDRGLRTILCGCYWIIAHKLDSWRIELKGEAGPYAHCIRNHHELVLGGLQLFGLFLRTAALLGNKGGHDLADAIDFRDRIRNELVQPLAELWAELNTARQIPDEDLARCHPMEEAARAKVVELRQKVIPFANEAEERFKQACGHISKQDWASWQNLAFEERLEFDLPANDPKSAPEEWAQLMANLLDRLDDVSDRARLQQLCLVQIEHPEIEPNEQARASNLVRMIGRLLDIDFSGTLDLVCQRLITDKPTTPAAFYELQLIGHVLRTVRRAANRPMAAQKLHALITALLEVDKNRWGRPAALNAILARLLAAYFVVVSEDHADSISNLWTLGQKCIKGVANDPHFFQTLAKDVLRLIGRQGGALAKMIILARLVPRSAVRWPDRLIELEGLWQTDSVNL
jgi:hypothetical protein